MATERKSRRRRRRQILMKNDGSLFDATEGSRITHAELREYIRDGGLFEARRHETGADCTYEVLHSVMGAGVLQNLAPGLGSASLPGAGAFPGLGGLAQLSVLANGGSGLAELVRALGGSRDAGWDDAEQPRRPSTGRLSENQGWAEGEWPEKSQG